MHTCHVGQIGQRSGADAAHRRRQSQRYDKPVQQSLQADMTNA